MPFEWPVVHFNFKTKVLVTAVVVVVFDSGGNKLDHCGQGGVARTDNETYLKSTYFGH